MLHPSLGLPYPEDGKTTFGAYLRALTQSPTVFGRGLLTLWLLLALAFPQGWAVAVAISCGTQVAAIGVGFVLWRRT